MLKVKIQGYEVTEGLYYSKNWMWVKVENDGIPITYSKVFQQETSHALGLSCQLSKNNMFLLITQLGIALERQAYHCTLTSQETFT